MFANAPVSKNKSHGQPEIQEVEYVPYRVRKHLWPFWNFWFCFLPWGLNYMDIFKCFSCSLASPGLSQREDKRRVRLRIYFLGSLAADWLVPPAKGPAPIRWFFSYNVTKHIVEIENYRPNYLGSAIIEIVVKALSHTFWETLSRNHLDKD